MAIADFAQVPGADASAKGSTFLPVRWARSLRRKGIRGVLDGRLYVARQWYLRKYFSLMGDRIRAYGLTFVVDNPLITPNQKHYLRKEVHEADEVRLTTAYLDPTRPTVELGGSIGVVACLTSRMLRRPEDHVVVEANPLVVPTLQKNRELNGCRFEVVTAALAYGAPMVEFTVGPDCMTGAMKAAGSQKLRVPAVSLREIVEPRGFQAINLIVDVEGAEIDLVANELDFLKERVKLFFLETHERMLQDGSTRRMIADLERAGFRILEGDREDPFVFAFVNQALADAAP